MSEAKKITKGAKSNLAFAFACLPAKRRRDMVTLYAFCRIVDDLADDPDIPMDQRRSGLDNWKACFNSTLTELAPIQQNILSIRDEYNIPNKLFLDLIEGCESDLEPHRRYGNWEQLSEYTYRVACCVGLISIRIFGCTNPKSEDYAINLGHALQLTNILRDVGEDLSDNVRIYLPENDLHRFQYTERDLVGRVYDGRFISMMNYIADRAEAYYEAAKVARTPEDKKALRSAEAMRKIYHGILIKMREDNFKVFEKRYTLSKPKKVWTLLSTFAGFSSK